MMLYIIRHGDPIYDPDSLTELGHRQAEALAKRLSVNGIDRVFTSPNGRARMTAEPLCRELGLEAEIEPWTSENLSFDQFKIPMKGFSFMLAEKSEMKSEESLAFGDRWYESPALKKAVAPREGYERIARESDAFTEKLGYKREDKIYKIIKPSDERVAVFCHQGFGVTWLSHLLGINPLIFWSSFDISHSAITILNFENRECGYTVPVCLCLSDMSHIYEAGLPLKHCGQIDL